MAKKETLDLEVRVRGDDDVKDLAENLEDTEKAADKAAAAIVQMGQKIDSELRESAAAADALAQALGPELTAKADVTSMVADLQKMGLTLEDIRAEADTLATALKQVDDIKMQGLRDGIDYSDASMQRLRGSSDQSRSVLANLAGNAAQDLGQLGGVVGTLGVGIGQLAEYAVDGNIALSNLAKVAGPMAGLALALAGINKYLGEQRRIEAWRTAQVEGYAAAVEEVGIGLGAIEEHLSNVADESFAAAGGVTDFLSGTGELPNVAAAFGVLGVNIGEVSEAIAAGASDTDAGAAAVEGLKEQLAQIGVVLGDDAQLFEFVREQQDAYAKSTSEAAAEAKFFASTADSVDAALDNQAASAKTVAANWSIVTTAMENGTMAAGPAVNAWQNLRNELHLSEADMAAMAEQKLAEKLEEDAAAAEEAAEALQKLSAMLIEVNDALNNAESRAAGFAAALARLDPGRLGEGMEIAGFVDDLESLGEAVSKVNLDEIDLIPPSDDWQAWLNMPDEAQGVLEAMSGFRDSIDAEMTQAFAEGGAEGVRAWAVDARKAITDELKAAGVESDAAINQVLEALGLLPSQVTTKVDLAVDEQKLAIVDSIVSGLGEIPPNVAANISVAVNNNDPDEAFRILNDYLLSIGEEPVVVTVNAETGEFMVQMDYVAGAADEATAPRTAVVTVDDEGTVQQVSDDADTATEDRDLLVIVPKSPTLGQMNDLINEVAKARTVNFISKADNAGQIDAILDGVAAQRYATITGFAQTNEAEYKLNYAARDRHANIYVHTVNTGGGGGGYSGGGGGAGAGQQMAPAAAPAGVATLTAAPTALSAAPTAVTAVTSAPPPAPVTNHYHVAVNAGVIGNRFDVMRAVSAATRQAARLGRR